MKKRKDNDSSVSHDAAVAEAMVILEEFFPHCPNGMAGAIHERLADIIEAAIETSAVIRQRARNEPSNN